VPELPEVETVRRGLEPVLVGRRLTRVEARRPDLRFPLPDRFAERLEGARVEALLRRAKYLVANLDTGETLIAHLGMSGRFTIRTPMQSVAPGAFYYADDPDPTHTHIVFTTDAGDRIEYNDPRRFGFMDIAATADLAGHKSFRTLGPEPLGPEFDAAALAAAVSGSRQPVKTALLDQSVVAGLGNIYVCEALHLAGISPVRRAGRVSARRLGVLVATIRVVLEAAIAAGGSSLKDFADAQGALGYFQHRFRVYDREGAPCQREGCGGVVARRVQAGRSTFYCPICQT
jgi:formamidopyrimidine-DNA glycosylase